MHSPQCEYVTVCSWCGRPCICICISDDYPFLLPFSVRTPDNRVNSIKRGRGHPTSQTHNGNQRRADKKKEAKWEKIQFSVTVLRIRHFQAPTTAKKKKVLFWQIYFKYMMMVTNQKSLERRPVMADIQQKGTTWTNQKFFLQPEEWAKGVPGVTGCWMCVQPVAPIDIFFSIVCHSSFNLLLFYIFYRSARCLCDTRLHWGVSSMGWGAPGRPWQLLNILKHFRYFLLLLLSIVRHFWQMPHNLER